MRRVAARHTCLETQTVAVVEQRHDLPDGSSLLAPPKTDAGDGHCAPRTGCNSPAAARVLIGQLRRAVAIAGTCATAIAHT